MAPRATLTFAWLSTSLSRLLACSVVAWARGKEWKVKSDAPDAGLEQHLGAERRQEGHSRHGGCSAPAAGA